MILRPGFIGFDGYGTPISFEMGPAAERLFGVSRLTDIRQLPALLGL